MTFRIILRTLLELFLDLKDYYFSNYPILLLLGAFRRLKRRLKCLWIPRGRGRPPISNEIIDLILEMKRSNWNWGALRISQELKLLGISVSKTKVAQILRENGLIPPRTRVTPISWNAFYQHHKHIWSVDFTSVFDIRGRQLFVFSIIDVASRKLVNINVTANPDRYWIIQQFRNASMHGQRLPDFVVSDNDGIYGNWLQADLKDIFHIQLMKTPPKMPWLNPYVERFQRTLKFESLQRIELGDISRYRSLCQQFQKYYNQNRPHQGIEGKTPENDVQSKIEIKQNQRIKFHKHSELDGLVSRFSIAA